VNSGQPAVFPEGEVFLTDGGLETTLIFERGLDLPAFASFPLVDRPEGIEELRRYYDPYLALAAERDLGFVIETPTWRASSRWAGELGVEPDRLEELNRQAVGLVREIRDRHAGEVDPILVSGNIGPMDDGYHPSRQVSVEEAEAYHGDQIRTFADAGVDLVTAMTITSAEEGVGIVRAATDSGVPVVISYTVETDGRLPSGESLGDAIERTDELTGAGPVHYMINCAHPTHFDDAVAGGGGWRDRVRGLRCNASMMSHEELDEAEELDDGDPADFGRRQADLRHSLPRVSVLGGCCGTDERHVAELRDAWIAAAD
jgi:S-methylmethionine-dependent homocysteine/selenocysteine methylase